MATARDARAAYAEHATTLDEMSPLLGRWARRVGSGGALSDAAVVELADPGGVPAAKGWIGVRKVFAGVLAVLQDVPDPLRALVPVLGGHDDTGDAFDVALTAFADAHLEAVVALLPRMLVANDPASGLALWREVPADAAGADLLVIGAGAGLELVADALDPGLAWRPRSRRGVDTAPIDVRDDESMRWLLGICPPDDVERFERTQRAIELAREADVRIDGTDAVTAIREADPDRPLVVMGASVLCMLADPAQVGRALRARSGPSWFVSDEVVGVHRLAGNGDGLDELAAGDRVVRVVRSGR